MEMASNYKFINFFFELAKTTLLFQVHKEEVLNRMEYNEGRVNVLKGLEVKIRELLVQVQKEVAEI